MFITFKTAHTQLASALTADDLAMVSGLGETEGYRSLFIKRSFKFVGDDSERIHGAISVVTGFVDGVVVRFVAQGGELQPSYLFFDHLRESQGTPDYGRWHICCKLGTEFTSKPGHLFLEPWRFTPAS